MMSNWELVDAYEPIAEPWCSTHAGIVINDANHLHELLSGYATQRPRILFLISPSGESLMIGIGSPLAKVSWHGLPHPHNHRQAVAAEILTDSPVEFQQEGSQSGAWPKNLLPVQEAIAIILHFYKTSLLADWIVWE